MEFIRNEGFHLEYLILIWRKAIPPENRIEGLDILLEYRDTPALLRAFQRSFGNIIAILDLLDRSPADRRDLPCGSRICRLPNGELPVFSWNSTARLEAIQHLIRNQSANVVVLSADLENPVLFHDAAAIRSMKAFTGVQWDKPFIEMLGGQLAKTLTALRICRFADAVIVPDDSLAWFQRLGFRTIRLSDEKTIDEIIPEPETVRSAESFRKLFAVLDPAVRVSSQFVIEPSADGETFVPFFRKLNKLFLALPAPFRKKCFSFLGRTYNRLRGY